jgi:hypothetical protein
MRFAAHHCEGGDGYTAQYVRAKRGVWIDQDGASFQWALGQGSCPLQSGPTSWGLDCFDALPTMRAAT